MRVSTEPGPTFAVSDDDLGQFRRLFQEPDEAELQSSEIGPPPLGYSTWDAWAAERWPTSAP